MPFYIVKILNQSGATIVEADMAVVHATNADDARAIAASGVKGDPSVVWETPGRTVTEELTVPMLAGWSQYEFHVGLIPELGGTVGGFDFRVIGATTELIGDILQNKVVPALITRGLTASYSPPILTMATIANAKGNWKVLFDIYPPATYKDPRPCNGIITEILDRHGTNAAALTVAFNVSSTPPVLFRLGRQL